MNILELFSGTATLANEARKRGHNTFTIDLFEPSDWQVDLLAITGQDILNKAGWEHVDMVWASPICTGFSVAAIGRSWDNTGEKLKPKSDAARLSLALLNKTFELLEELNPRTWYVENPRGMARRMDVVQPFPRHTVTLCQYGDFRMKPTDVWSNNPFWVPRPACKAGAPCHEAAPRGSRTGTQGLKSAKLRAKMPEELCVEVIKAAEEHQ